MKLTEFNLFRTSVAVLLVFTAFFMSVYLKKFAIVNSLSFSIGGNMFPVIASLIIVFVALGIVLILYNVGVFKKIARKEVVANKKIIVNYLAFDIAFVIAFLVHYWIT